MARPTAVGGASRQLPIEAQRAVELDDDGPLWPTIGTSEI